MDSWSLVVDMQPFQTVAEEHFIDGGIWHSLNLHFTALFLKRNLLTCLLTYIFTHCFFVSYTGCRLASTDAHDVQCKWSDRGSPTTDLDVNTAFLGSPSTSGHALVSRTNGGLRLPEEVFLPAAARLRPDRRLAASEPQRLGCADPRTPPQISAGRPPGFSTSSRRGVLLPTGGLRQRRAETADAARHDIFRLRTDGERFRSDSIRHLCQLLPAV